MNEMWHLLKWAVGVVVLGYVSILVALWFMQSKLVYHPTKTVGATPVDVGLAYERLWLQSSNGANIEAWYVPTADNESARGTVLFCHGNGGNISHRLETLLILHRLGMNTLIFDYQGYGNSEGTPGEVETYADAETCLEWLEKERGEMPERIVFMGRSLGGGVASYMAEHHDCAGLILESTFTSIPDMGARMYPFLPVRTLGRIAYGTQDRLNRITVPLLVVHSPEDDLVPFALGQTLYAGYAGPKAFLEISGGHNEGFLLTGPAYDEGLGRFLEDILQSKW